MRKKYETDLTEEQWEVIAPLFVNMRNRNWEKRELVNAVLYLVKTGCQWRILLCTAFIDKRGSADCGTQFSLIL
ncbi:MAG: transposase [Selenomonadaceae bacterium]|nr:transposase [Selenomonadaceae bacterium]